MQMIYRLDPADPKLKSVALASAAQSLRAGALALLPTETVYGVGVSVAAFADGAPGTSCAPKEGTGYRRIFSLKQRPVTQTVPWLVDGPRALDEFAHDVDPRARRLAQELWPGALTIVVPAAPTVPAFMRAGDGTVALRASASPVVRALIHACGSPLAVTSANTHGMPAPAAFDQVEPRILEGVDIAIDAGATSCQDASTIVSFASGDLQVLREGAIPAERVRAALEG